MIFFTLQGSSVGKDDWCFSSLSGAVVLKKSTTHFSYEVLAVPMTVVKAIVNAKPFPFNTVKMYREVVA